VIPGVAVNPVTSVADFRAQPASAATVTAAPTDLPPARAVIPAPDIPPARTDTRKPDKSTPGTSRAVVVDPQTDTLVFQSIDPNSGIVLQQVPSAALLRQQAYVNAQTVQALITGKDPAAAAVAATAQDVDTTA
jgi:flagellar protein FlaG